MKTKRAYKYRFYPTAEQENTLANTFGCVRFVYNYFLTVRQEAWYKRKDKIDYHETSFLLSELKKNSKYLWLNDVSCVPTQQSLRHLHMAFINFWKGISRYPTFKKKMNKQSATYANNAFKWNDNKLILAKMNEPLNIRWSRKFNNKPSTVTISKDPSGRYFVSFLVEENIKPKPVVNSTIGIDVGIKDICVTSDGFKSGSPKYTKRFSARLAKAQQRLAKKKKGSANRTKARIKVAKIHAKIKDSRHDFLHKLSTKLINENQVISTETLAVKNKIKNPKLSKAISDSGWGEFLRQLEYKSKWYGRTLIGIDRWYPSSKRCSVCGYTVSSLPLDIRLWECPECHTAHDRDINAAKNIKAAGLAVLAFGEDVSIVSKLGITCPQ